jgi:integrase
MSVNPLKSTPCNPVISLYAPASSHLTREKSGRGMAGGKEPQQFPKTDFRHWERKVFKSSYREDGGRTEAKTYSVRIAYRGARHSFPLGLSNLRESAKKARDIYMHVLSHGWEGTLAHYKPDYAPPEPEAEEMTVGRYIEVAGRVSKVRPRTLHGYFVGLRSIAGGVLSLEDRGAGTKAERRQKVEEMPLANLTFAKVEAWKAAYRARAGADLLAQRRAEATFNSVLRQAKALFSKKKILAEYAKLKLPPLSLPDPLPLEGVDLWEQSISRFKYESKIDPAVIIERAAAELGGKPEFYECWKIFVLALLCGLRKAEIDYLEWRLVELDRGLLRIQETSYFSPKSKHSACVDLDKELVEILREAKARSTGPFVIESGREPRGPGKHSRYRAWGHFEKLNQWLREQGITARKPLHELRKEAGSLVIQLQGIYAAQQFLRHSTPDITAKFYADKKESISTGLGKLLAVPPSTGGSDEAEA